MLAAFSLGINGNAITVSPALHTAIADAADGDIADPLISAQALARVVTLRKAQGLEPLTFGMTFPFSSHNYDLRFWMAAGGVDPDEDVRLVVLPPPYMVESLANKHLDGFCVGAPWNSVAIDLGIGKILHFSCELFARAVEKLLTVRQPWAAQHPDELQRLVRAHGRAAAFIEDTANRDEVCALLTAPGRIEVTPELILRTLDGRMKVAPDGAIRSTNRYLLVGRANAARPDPVQAAWYYAQMVRWGQAPLSADRLEAARAVFRPDLYDAALGASPPLPASEPADGIGEFTGAAFDSDDIAGYLAGFKIRR
jgi:NitT/TauT family transport system ATP-binding protein